MTVATTTTYSDVQLAVLDRVKTLLNFEAFDEVVMDSLSSLTHAALIGKRKQSLVDAE